MKTKLNRLHRDSAYIDGKWLNSKKKIEVINPATGAIIGSVPNLTRKEAKKAINAAQIAYKDWAKQSAKARASILKKWYEILKENSENIAQIITAENGKPIAEARVEVASGIATVEFFAEEAKRAYGETIPSHKIDARIITINQPIGVVAAITPWNFPFSMLTRKLSPALAAGCSIVCKPAEETPLSALALVALADEAGIPKGLINIITGEPQEIGKELTSNSDVKLVTFTGSTEVGKLLMQQSASTVKKVALELGGNAPFIIFDDADIEQAVNGAIAAKYRNNGQTCICANRILVQDNIYNEFLDKISNKIKSLKVGNGAYDGVNLGPLINKAALKKIQDLIYDATNKGAKVLLGGKLHDLGGNFFEPTLITDIKLNMDIVTQEIFGPIATIIKFKDENEAIKIANSTQYGLAAYFYARDIGRCWRVAEELEYGMVGINDIVLSTEVAPFGGIKESGLGREGSHHSLTEFMEIKYILMGGI